MEKTEYYFYDSIIDILFYSIVSKVRKYRVPMNLCRIAGYAKMHHPCSCSSSHKLAQPVHTAQKIGVTYLELVLIFSQYLCSVYRCPDQKPGLCIISFSEEKLDTIFFKLLWQRQTGNLRGFGDVLVSWILFYLLWGSRQKLSFAGDGTESSPL